MLRRILIISSILFLPATLFATVLQIVPNTTSISVGVGESTVVEFAVKNVAPNQTAVPGNFTLQYPTDSNITISQNTASSAPCSETSQLAYNQSCNYQLQITGNAVTTNDIMLRPTVCGFNGSGPCDIASSTNALNIAVSQANKGGRIFTIKNMCPFRVSLGFVSGSVQEPLIPNSGNSCSQSKPCASPLVCAYSNPSATTGICSPMKDIYCNPDYYNNFQAQCKANDEVCGTCPNGSSCNVNAGPLYAQGQNKGLCFSAPPQITSPASGSHVLAAGSESNPAIATATLIPSLTSVDVKWSGGIFPRLIPQSGTATTIAGWCRSDKDATKACDLGQGPQPPYTGAEFTLLRDSVDTYDTTLINGPTIPISMSPTSITRNTGNAYSCGAAGDTSAQSSTDYNLPAASWTFSNPNGDVGYNFVHLTSSSVSCTTANANSVCTGDSAGGTTCGIGYTPGTANVEEPKCGTLVGHWAAANACASGSSYLNNLFSCNTPYLTATYKDLYQCSGVAPDSCNQGGATTTCCGCSNWSGLATPTHTCNSQNPTWLLPAILNNISWLKAGSPTSYSYPYDDTSSTFSCPASASSNDVGKVNYTVTFCPGGEVGGITPPSGF
jgi:hypothetical protein